MLCFFGVIFEAKKTILNMNLFWNFAVENIKDAAVYCYGK